MPAWSNAWELLGIAPTAEVRAIKRAYAQRLKVVRPDEQPEQFQHLRAAYEWALAQAANAATTAITANWSPVPTAPGHQDALAEAVTPATAPPQAPPPPPRVAAAPADPATAPAGDPEADAGAPAARATTTDYGWRGPRVQAQARPPSPARVGHDAWRAVLSECREEMQTPFQTSPIGTLRHSLLHLLEELAAAARQPELDNLEARIHFQSACFDYCASDQAAPLMRIACLRQFDWAGESKFLSKAEHGVAQQAIARACADAQYLALREQAANSAAMQDMLKPGTPAPRLRQFYRAAYRNDVRQLLRQLDSSASQAADLWFEREALARWRDAAARHWPTPAALCWTALAGLLMTSLARQSWTIYVDPHRSWLDNDGVIGAILAAGTLLSLALVLALPHCRFSAIGRAADRVNNSRHGRAMLWGAGALLALLPFFERRPPSALVAPFLGLSALLLLAEWLLQRKLRTHYVTQAVIFSVLLALKTKHGWNGWNPAVLLCVMVLTASRIGMPHALMIVHYGIDLSRSLNRLRALGAGFAVVLLQLALAPRLPALAAALGWCWILGAAGAADLFCTFIIKHHGTGLRGLVGLVWFIGLIFLFLWPQELDLESPIADVLYLQITVATSIGIALLGQAFDAARAKFRPV